MSDSETLETSPDGRFRVRLIRDEYAAEPYDDGQSPLLQLEYRGSWRATHVMATGRPLDDDARIEEAAERWGYGTNAALLEKYLRAYYGVTAIESWHSGDYWYVTYDPARWREHVGADAGSVDLSEYRAWCEGDVWGYVVEKRVTWHTDDPGYEDETRWEATDDSCWGFYGSDGPNGAYLEQTARDALADADEPYAHMAGAHEIAPDLLARWDRETVTSKHAKYHEAAWAATIGHVHTDPGAPFAITPEPAPAS